MNVWARVKSAISSPKRTYRHARLKLVKKSQGFRAFDAGKVDRLTSFQESQSWSANVDIYRALRVMRARSRDEFDNGDYTARFIQLCKNGIVGPEGIHLQIQTDNPAVNETVIEAWHKWCESCDVIGSTFVDIQELYIETVARDGEGLTNFVIQNNELKLQILDVDLLDIENNDPQNNVIMGVQCDLVGKPIAYHILSKHPSDYLEKSTGEHFHKVFPASQILHTFRRYRAGQRRGIPWAHTTLRRLAHLNGYEEAEVVAARTAATKMGFFTRNEQGEGYLGDENDDKECIAEAEPGTFEELPYGVDFKPWNPEHPAGNYGPFIKSVLRGIASGLGISYFSISNDLSEANYSSLKEGLSTERDNWVVLQNWFIRNFIRPVFKKWLEIEMLSGRLNIPFTEYENICRKLVCRGRRWQWVDPAKEITAIGDAIDRRIMSYSEAIRQQGRDPDAVWNELQRDFEKMKALGISPTDLNAVLGGKNPTPPPAEANTNDE